MKFWQKLSAATVLTGLVAGLTSHVAAAQAAIKMDGSSTVFPIAEAMAEEFQISKRGKVHVTVGLAELAYRQNKIMRFDPKKVEVI